MRPSRGRPRDVPWRASVATRSSSTSSITDSGLLVKARMARAGLFLAGFLVLAAAPRTHACDVCTTYCPADDPDGVVSKGLQLGMAEQFTYSGTVRLGETEISNRADQYLSSSATRFFLSYTMSDKLDLQLHLPILHRAFRRFQGVRLDEGTLTGLGDVTLVSGLTVARKAKANSSIRLKALGGFKLPTGSTEVFDELDPNNPHGADGAFPDPKDAVHPHQLALGTGSLDLVLGVDVAMAWNRVSLAAAAQFSNPLLTRDDFRPGESLNWLMSGGFSVLNGSSLELALRA